MNTNLMNLGLLVFFILLLYFMMIRPQRKRDKEVQDMRSSLTRGDEIVTIGGIIGKVVTVKEDTVVINVGKGNTNIEILKSAVGSVTKPNESARKEREEKKAAAEEVKEPKTSDKKVTPKKLTPKKEEAEEEVASEE